MGTSSYGQACGGTLVQTASIPVVVTAAHCVFSDTTVKNTYVVLGGYNRWSGGKDLGGGTLYKLKVCVGGGGGVDNAHGANAHKS
jgi:hypothetical protein